MFATTTSFESNDNCNDNDVDLFAVFIFIVFVMSLSYFDLDIFNVGRYDDLLKCGRPHVEY